MLNITPDMERKFVEFDRGILKRNIWVSIEGSRNIEIKKIANQSSIFDIPILPGRVEKIGNEVKNSWWILVLDCLHFIGQLEGEAGSAVEQPASNKVDTYTE